MKRKTHGLSIVAAIVLAGFVIVVWLHILLNSILRGEEHLHQSNVESKLPTGNYLPDAENPLIRVIIRTNGFSQIAHTEVKVSAESGLRIQSGETQHMVDAGVEFCVTPEDSLFQSGSIWIEPQLDTDRIQLQSLTRGCGTPLYRGKMELFATAEGIVIVNELPVEEYLYGVVPSEMPASYEMEALKCQAVCARSYAYCQMKSFAYPEYSAHVDDSVSFQVYANSGEKDSTIQAVDATINQKLRYGGEVVITYYYSTSCGKTTSIEAWGTDLAEHNRYLCGVAVQNAEGKDYEEQLPWYRWEATVPIRTLSDLVELNTGMEIGTVQDIKVTKRGTGGVALQLVAEGTEGKIVVNTENKIRSALGGGGYQIKKNDGTMVNGASLLPSAFFTIAKDGENYIIKGGGYGHGIGMSQNGANEMAKAGKNYEEILTFFYPGTKVE